MAQTRSFNPATALLIPAALLPWAPPLAAAAGDAHREERVICIANNDENPIEITDSKAMTRVVRWRRHSKDFGAPASPQPAHAPAAQRHWTLGPGMKAEFVVSGTSPYYDLAISNGRAKVHCTFDNYGGEPRLVGKEGLASLTPAGDHYEFAFEETKRLDAVQEPQAEFVVRVELDPVADQEVKDLAHPGLPVQGSYRFVPAVDRLDAGQKQALIGLGNPPPRPARPRRSAPPVPDAAAQSVPVVVLPVAEAVAGQAQDRPWAPDPAWAEKVRAGKREHGWRKNPWQPSLTPVAAGERLAPADLAQDFLPEAAPEPTGRLAPIALHGDTALESGSLKAMREARRRKRLEAERQFRMERRQQEDAERRASKAEPSAPAQQDQPVHADLMSLYGL